MPRNTNKKAIDLRSMRYWGRLAVVVLIAVSLTGCAVFTINTMDNEQRDPKTVPNKTRTALAVTADDLSDEVFIGIALSGGGSRAANFSAAVLLELEHIGILQRATALSSVSGSSLPTAYYGLYGTRKDTARWNPAEVRRQMRKDFELRWIGRWFLPQNILTYWTTNFNRSDIMKEVLDSNLFHGESFAARGSGRPRILINATSLLKGDRFVFSEEQFQSDLHARVDTFPIANAVMASSAFPGAFHDMTLKDYTNANDLDQEVRDQKRYKHVLDGGPSDNLGTTTLLEMVAQLYRAPRKPKGCFLIVVDAYPYPQYSEQTREADTRSMLDFVFDTNVAKASDAMLTARRTDLMSDLNVDVRTPNIEPFQPNIGEDSIWPDQYDADLRADCAVWHLSLQRLLSDNFARKAAARSTDPKKDKEALAKDITNVAQVVNTIPTRYKLKGKDQNNAALDTGTLQNDLFDAASYLMYLDSDKENVPILKRVCDWFADRNIRDLHCSK